MKTKLLLHVVLCCALILTLGILGGCGEGDTGPVGKDGADGQDLTSAAKPEACAGCHSTAGQAHQDAYDERYQDGVIVVSNLTYTYATDKAIVTFEMTKDDGSGAANFDCTQADKLGIYFTEYDGVSKFPSDQTLTGTKSTATPPYSTTLTYDGVTNVCTNTFNMAGIADFSTKTGLIVLYGRDETVETVGHVAMAKYPFAAIIETNGAVNYASAANVAGCEKCHTRPFLKHAYIYGSVGGKEFYTCKACHYDNRTGGHPDWQVLVDDPARYAGIATTPLSTDEKAKYAYKARLMNDVHMSHSMEFGYPQSMANCATCHEGKLAATLADVNYTIETCRSCHPVTAADGTQANRAPALITLMTATNAAGTGKITSHDSFINNLYADATTPPPTCTGCHGSGTIPSFNEIHTGYNDIIYADTAGTKYSDAISVTIDSATYSAYTMTISFSASGSAGGLNATDIVPEVMIGLYGYDTKHFIVNGHDRYDANHNGVISRSDGDLPKGAYEVGTVHDYWTTVSSTPGAWTVTTDLSEWSGMINDGTIKRVEIAVLPVLKKTTGEEVALNAPSRTFDLGAKAFDDTFYSPVVNVANGCNSCHDALATTFHSPDRGGNVTVCRMCHVGLAGGSHLEMQSRSIDSYIHAIHSFQPFDIDKINFADPVEAVHYEHHIESLYPTFGITNCESCHNPGTYEVPSQSKSLPSLLSGSDTVENRNISDVPSYVTGPASRACGSCHRSKLINEDAAGGLAALNEHFKTFGYMLEETGGVLDAVIESIMSIFK